MATGSTPVYSLPYPLPTDSVDVAGDIQALAGRLELVLPGLSAPNVKVLGYNTSASAITIGDPVYITGIYSVAASATIVEIHPSDASASVTMPAQAIAVSSIGAGTEGEIILSGIADAYLDTSAYSVGQVLYVNSGGGLTGTKPTYPIKAQAIAAVVKSDASEGMIMMLSGGGGVSTPLTWGQLIS